MTTLQLPQTLHFASETYHFGGIQSPNRHHRHHHHHHSSRLFSTSATLPLSVASPKMNSKVAQEQTTENDVFHDYATVIMDVVECYMAPSPTLEEKLTELEEEVTQEINKSAVGEEKLIELDEKQDPVAKDCMPQQTSGKQITASRHSSTQNSFLNNFRRSSIFKPTSSTIFDFQLNNQAYFAQRDTDNYQSEENDAHDCVSARSYNSTISAQPKKLRKKQSKMNKRVKSFTQRVKNEDVSHRLTDLFQDDQDIWAKEKLEKELSLDGVEEGKTSCSCANCDAKAKRRVVIKESENEYIYPTPTISSFRRNISRRFHIFKHHVM
ncbi:hypothetical protein CANMA_002525 [Candida margitis]|uniref:uncharacterized protein n=1 Tax=Candida margitis TaxID=1775924 RepID=UPI002227671C|nr:uncharacterized protein CANMA_002525 [Candida margitis]KAI5968309.1 hypothetical protein CANMA_002525 [Candida margitis]